jgi:hypothetical protein
MRRPRHCTYIPLVLSHTFEDLHTNFTQLAETTICIIFDTFRSFQLSLYTASINELRELISRFLSYNNAATFLLFQKTHGQNSWRENMGSSSRSSRVVSQFHPWRPSDWIQRVWLVGYLGRDQFFFEYYHCPGAGPCLIRPVDQPITLPEVLELLAVSHYACVISNPSCTSSNEAGYLTLRASLALFVSMCCSPLNSQNCFLCDRSNRANSLTFSTSRICY